MADDAAGLVSAYYEILQAGPEPCDPQRLLFSRPSEKRTRRFLRRIVDAGHM